MSQNPIPSTIAPLVRRHAEDAAFYWSQHDGSAHSPRLRLASLERFSHLLTAHLEGLDVAGRAAWDPAAGALKRWSKPAEAFVAAHVAFSRDGDDLRVALWQLVEARPAQLLRGAISALAWLPRSRAAALITALTVAGTGPVRQVTALRALALMNLDARSLLAQPIEAFVRAPDPHVRAAAWRLAATLPAEDFLQLMPARALDDGCAAVRAEAAIACGRHRAARPREAPADLPARTLLQAVIAQAATCDGATGWDRMQAQRRLLRWLHWLAVLLPTGHEAIPALLGSLPARAGLSFIASHGDPAWLPVVTEAMADADTARHAGWVWHTLTGIDIEAAGLALQETPDEGAPVAVTEARLDADQGLPLPDPVAVLGATPVTLAHGTRYLLGQPISTAHALAVCEHGAQAQRAIALRHLSLALPRLALTPRGPVPAQRKVLLHLQALADGGVAA
ncbi:hypothetical protein [Pseudoduganella buxea]|uniref:TIGR02270 family protein n=1 Tax=Pseudoduganella buxea TaxID=1949069 RepID=A0A6I3T4Q9_9BURK|nr:hypothetical protein [Pseudoduganella buxea]MTV56434.1 hypothetical protein [Pseudoduganella buxea]GGC13583.1 hypothetical protein GCM10011572_38730 [Pseudoduganella buxea]